MTGKRGRPRTGPELVGLGTVSVPAEVAEAIDLLVASSGELSKSGFIRQALLAGLAPYALVSPAMAAALPTPYERSAR